MDFIFNRYIPKQETSIKDNKVSTIVFKPRGKTYINGMCDTYDARYSKSALEPYLTEKEFNHMI